MSVYLGYNEITKQYLKSLGGGGSGGSGSGDLSLSGFTMSGDIDMSGNEVIGLDDPSSDSSAASKKYVDDEIAKVPTGGGLDQAAADNRYLQKTDASSTYETQSDASNTYLSKASAAVTYLRNSVFNNTMRTYMSSPDIDTNFLRKTDAASTYALIGAAYAKAESDTRYARKVSGGGGSGGLSALGFTMTGDIDMGNNKILKLADPITSKSAANKEYVDNNFLSKHGGLILGDIAMSGQSITNLNPTPQNNNDAVTKGYVDNQIKLSGGLSLTGITMQGDIDMNGNEISGLVDPINDDMAASKGFVESNFLDLAGGAMVGNVDMGGYEITNMLRTPTTDLSAVTKKWVSDEFPTKQEVLGGFTLTGALNLSGNEIYSLPDTPTTDNSAASKKYVDSKTTGGSGGGLSDSGFTMKGDINMGGYEVIGVTSVPSFNNSLVNKKYVDDEVAAVTRGISQAQADARYVKKTKITLGEWTDMFSGINFVDYNWSRQVRKSILNSESNIETRVASFITDMSISQLLKHKLIIGIRYVDSSSTIAKHLVTIPLTGKTFSKLSYGSSGTDYMYSFHIHDEYYIGDDSDAKNSSLWQVGAKFEATKSHVLLDTSVIITFALNEAGQLG